MRLPHGSRRDCVWNVGFVCRWAAVLFLNRRKLKSKACERLQATQEADAFRGGEHLCLVIELLK